jgi:hypothetical protein
MRSRNFPNLIPNPNPYLNPALALNSSSFSDNFASPLFFLFNITVTQAPSYDCGALSLDF